MTFQSKELEIGFEDALLGTVRGLPPQRAVQVLDFARWLRTQPETEEWLIEDVTGDDLQAEDAHWDQFYAQNRDTFRAMASEAVEQYEAGETQQMTIDDGMLSAR